MVHAVDKRWNRYLADSKIKLKEGTSVTAVFFLDASGSVARIENVDATAEPAAVRACISAIADGAPYGVWTEAMKAALGLEQQMTFTFYYQ